MNNNQDKTSNAEYISRMNAVLDYIEDNISGNLSLEKLADVAGFSRFHFHRIFTAITGETTNQFIRRIRLEKGATKLLMHPDKSITVIAMECGFKTSASFAKAFKEHFKLSASDWRKKSLSEEKNSKIGQTDSNIGKEHEDKNRYIKFVVGSGTELIEKSSELRGNLMLFEKNVEVKINDLPEKNVAYVRHTGPYKGDVELFGSLFGKMCKWAGARQLINNESEWIIVYHDNPELTEAERLRTSVCLTVPEETNVDGEVGKMKIPAGKYAMGHFEIASDQYESAWNYMYGAWLPDSGFQPDDRPCFEICLNSPDEHPEKKHIVEICIPVKPL